MKEEHGYAEQAKLAGVMAQVVDIFLHAIADEDQGVDRALLDFLEGVPEHPSDLGMAADAIDPRHAFQQGVGVRQPRRTLAFPEAAIEDKLHLEAAEGIGLLEHAALDMAGGVPRRRPAGGGVHGEDQPPAPARAPRRGGHGDALEERIQFGAAAALR